MPEKMELEKQFIYSELWYMNNNAKVKIKWEFSIFHNTTSDLYVCLPLSIGGASNKRFHDSKQKIDFTENSRKYF